ncbi:hypothetical protein ACB092_07G196500 [Castanea dentata]
MTEIANVIAGKILEQLRSLINQELSSAWGVQSDLKKLESTMLAIKAVLFDAEEKEAGNHRLSLWLGQLKGVLNDTENVLDEFQYRVLQKEEVVKRCRSTCKKVRYFFSVSNPFVLRFEMAHKIKALKAEFNLAAQLEVRNTTMHKRDMSHMSHFFVPPQIVIGRDDDKKQIINILTQQDADRNVSVIPIVGIGGLGKTTLAKLVYHDEGVVSHFQLRMWACLQIHLREHIKDKKFLLVLDDVWNEDDNKWIELIGLLLGSCIGSKIIVTTRNSSVATTTGTAPTYNLKGLPPKDSLSLFLKFAFKEGQDHYPNLLEIGKEIVRKCKGIPLAIKTIAGILYSKVDEDEWKFVRDNEIWNLEQDGGILPALRLSYNQLPFHLKQCFAYCSLFPKNYVFYSIKLIQFWMAYGILQSPVNTNQDLEDVGALYIKELLSRSFFQDDNVHKFECITFKMHDLCSAVTKKSTLAAKFCHLTFLDNDQEVTTQLEKLSKVRTIIFQTTQPMSLLEVCISKFKYLRVLDLRESSFEVLPSFVGTLKHLRYLDLSDNRKSKQLPNSICKLHSLQTLLLENCINLERLPKGIRDIINLKLMIVTTKHTCLSEKASNCLNSLQFLIIYECLSLKCLFEGMDGCLANLRKLIVAFCPSLTSLSLSIKHLTALETLIIWDCEELSLMEGEENQDLELSLKKIMIGKLPKLGALPQWLQGSAITLQMLAIGYCKNLTALPEWLPRLKSLQTIGIASCPKLLSLPEGMQTLTSLRELGIVHCPDLSRKCKEYFPKIDHVPEFEINGFKLTIEKMS